MAPSAFRRALRVTALFAALAAGCVPEAEAPAAPVTQTEWTEARERLAELRQGRPDEPYVQRVRLGVFSARAGRKIEARGALAVDPGRAARLVVVGPGGMTALDAWVTPERFRFVIPAAHKEMRGGKAIDDTYGVPVAFLRWWMLAPLEGKLLTVHRPSAGAASQLVLGDGVATFTVAPEPTKLTVVRRAGGRSEIVEWFGRNLKPMAGQHGQYIDREHQLTVDIYVEEVMADPPDPEAFVDPDDPKLQQGQAP